MVENVEKESNTLGFSVSGAPIWLCKELSKEAKKYYANVYWPVLVDWYRKAKEFENMVRGGDPVQQEVSEPIEIEEKVESNKPKLFGKGD